MYWINIKCSNASSYEQIKSFIKSQLNRSKSIDDKFNDDELSIGLQPYTTNISPVLFFYKTDSYCSGISVSIKCGDIHQCITLKERILDQLYDMEEFVNNDIIVSSDTRTIRITINASNYIPGIIFMDELFLTQSFK